AGRSGCGGAVLAWFLVAVLVRGSALGTVSLSPMLCPPRTLSILVVGLGRHHSMQRRRLATPIPMDSAARSGKRAWPWVRRLGMRGAQGASPLSAHFPPRKSPISECIVPYGRGKSGKRTGLALIKPSTKQADLQGNCVGPGPTPSKALESMPAALGHAAPRCPGAGPRRGPSAPRESGDTASLASPAGGAPPPPR